MSTYERVKSKIKIITKKKDEFEKVMMDILNEKGVQKEKYETYGAEDYFRDMFYDEYVIGDNFIGKFIDKEEQRDDYDFVESCKIDEDTFYVHTLFYNGGTCFSEIAEEEIDKLIKDE